MKRPLAAMRLAIAIAVAAAAVSPLAGNASPQTSGPSQADVPAAAAAAVAIVERFGTALAAADYDTVAALLDPEVLILESGGAERNRAQYLQHHAISDAAFLQGAQVRLEHRRARTEGDLAWVANESEIRFRKDGQPRAVSSTETMLLKRGPQGWRIVHIHWSSRPKKTP